jgi:hypothetical protein
MSRRTDSLPINEVQFYDSCLPLLEADDYSISVTQTVNSTDADHPLSQTFNGTQNFSVLAPRFAMSPGDVQQFFPPRNAAGVFEQNLPHIVLKQRVLPWERRLSSDASPATPWVALLLFTPDQIIAPADQPAASAIANTTQVGTYPVTQLLHPTDASTLGPNVQAQVEDETTCKAIDITTDTFTAVTPRLAELAYLAHGRQVNVDNKATAIAMAGGWFSVVIGNRFPSGAQGASGTRNIAHLVSLEGYKDYLIDRPNWPSGITTVRLASLASWAFTSLPSPGNFRELMLALTKNHPEGGDTLRLRLPTPSTSGAQTPPPSSAGQAPSPVQKIQTALEQGYGAFAYDTRVGDHTFAWYHGPFVPQPIQPFSGLQSFPSSAAAAIYDAASGTFDLSYATAWEAGRLLALSDRAYSTSAVRARKATRKVVNLARERMRGAMRKGENADLGTILEPARESRSFVAWLAASAAAALPKRGTPAIPPPAERVRFKSGVLEAPATQLRSFLGRADVRLLVAGEVQKAMSFGAMKDVVNWMAGLRQLQGLPFVHLVPDARMLPAESIRFFYVDSNYLDALCDGASSVGVQTTRDVAEDEVVRPAIHAAAIAISQKRRPTLMRKTNLLRNVQPNDPVAGMLLRSAVVAGWPGLEVKAFASANGKTNKIEPIRFDHLAPDVLLVLWPAVPAWVEIDEPKEGLAFGVEDNNLVGIRYLAGDDAGSTTGATVTLDSTYLRDAATNVVDIAKWQTYLAGQVPSGSQWGPAAFAVEMVRAPEQMIFQNGSTTAPEATRG